jgi:Tfp pilus assembly protein PilN
LARRINLVPRAERARTTTNVGMLAVVTSAIVVLFGLGLGYYLFSNTLNDRKDELESKRAERESLEAQVRALQSYEDLATQRQDAEEQAQTIYAGRTLVSSLLDDMSLVVPDDVWFVTLDLRTADPSTGAASADGVSDAGSLSVEGDTYGFDNVAAFLVRLQLVPALSNIDLVSAGDPYGTVDETKDVKGFSITATVNNTQAVDAPLPMSLTEVEGL